MKKDIWICVVHTYTFAQPSVVSSDGYSSLTKAQDALVMRLRGTGYWENEFVYIDEQRQRRYELKCVTIED